MTTTPNANAYLKTRVMTAPPEQLRLMLLDGSIRFARMAREAMDTKDYEAIYEGFTNARAIVLELGESIKPDPDAELARNMKGVYTFIYSELVHSSIEKDTARLDKAIELLEYERETWKQFIDKLERERSEGLVDQNDRGAIPQGDAPARASLSVQA
jgi:flagellar protein FliS